MLRTVNRIRNLPREREVVQVIARHNLGYILRRYAFGRFLLRFTGTPSDERLPVHWGDELRAMLLATLQAPLQQFVRLLQAPTQNFVYVLAAKERVASGG